MVALGRQTTSSENSVDTIQATAFGSEIPSARADGFRLFRNQFLSQMGILMGLIEDNGPVIGVGAGLMTPVYDYHLKGAIGRLPVILDDDASKNGTSYRNLDVPIALPDKAKLPSEFSALITSLENPKPIFRRAMELGAVKILGLPIS